MAGRVLPVERIRAEIDQLFSSDRDLASILEDVARLSVRLVFQAALEAEVEEFLGRARYQRRGDADRPGSRNGHQPPMTVKTTMGAVELQRPKLRGTDQAFCSRLFGAGVTRTHALESLVISGWVRGLSDRDIEATLAEVLGPEAALSKSTVSRICAAIGEEFAAWRTRDLSGVRLDYLFLDASHFKMHPGAPAEPVLAAGAPPRPAPSRSPRRARDRRHAEGARRGSGAQAAPVPARARRRRGRRSARAGQRARGLVLPGSAPASVQSLLFGRRVGRHGVRERPPPFRFTPPDVVELLRIRLADGLVPIVVRGRGVNLGAFLQTASFLHGLYQRKKLLFLQIDQIPLKTLLLFLQLFLILTIIKRFENILSVYICLK